MRSNSRLREWIARVFIGLVLGMNLACAVDFVFRPELYLAAYELSGEVGRVVIIGYGILFFMWQDTLLFCFLPSKTPQGFFDPGNFDAGGWVDRRKPAVTDDSNRKLRIAKFNFALHLV